MLRHFFSKTNSEKPTFRVEAFSDGVFAIAITLLILNIEVPRTEELRSGLMEFLGRQWPSYVAFPVGFLSVLVCWLNHQHIFHHIVKCDTGLGFCNAYILLLVTIVPFPTRLLAEYVTQPESDIVLRFYGATFLLMASAYFLLSWFAYKKKLFGNEHDDRKLRAIVHVYAFSVVYTTVSFALTFISIPLGLVMYAVMFAIYLFPAHFAAVMHRLIARTPEAAGAMG